MSMPTLEQLLMPDAPRPAAPLPLPISKRNQARAPEKYLPSAPLRDAFRVALELRQPLLLTGDPGTGKTRAADYLAYRLGLRLLRPFRTKSTSTARELLYSYDAIGRFNAKNEGTDSNLLRFIQYGPLGEAILLANTRAAIAPYLIPGFEHSGPVTSVVLIDEIDKAPRDFPNDFLGELEEMRFSIPEIGIAKEISAPDESLPIVVITSNSEKDLPEAFLRRCVYCNIPFPGMSELEAIVLARLTEIQLERSFLDAVLAAFGKLRAEKDRFRKAPGTSELLEWIRAIQRLQGHASTLDPTIAARTLGTVFKTREDLIEGARIVGYSWG